MYNNSNGGQSPPLLKKPETLEARFQHAPAWVRWGLISLSGLVFLGSAVFVCVLVGSAFPQPTSQPDAEAKLAMPTPMPTPTPSPTPTPTPGPTQPPEQQPDTPSSGQPQQPAPAPVTGVYGNPWGYDFNFGNKIYDPPYPTFCNGVYFSCVTTFWKSTNGYVVKCGNNLYSHSGGVNGACSRDGGVAAILYSH